MFIVGADAGVRGASWWACGGRGRAVVGKDGARRSALISSLFFLHPPTAAADSIFCVFRGAPMKRARARSARRRSHRTAARLLYPIHPSHHPLPQEDIGAFLEEKRAAVDALLVSLTTMVR